MSASRLQIRKQLRAHKERAALRFRAAARIQRRVRALLPQWRASGARRDAAIMIQSAVRLLLAWRRVADRHRAIKSLRGKTAARHVAKTIRGAVLRRRRAQVAARLAEQRVAAAAAVQLARAQAAARDNKARRRKAAIRAAKGRALKARAKALRAAAAVAKRAEAGAGAGAAPSPPVATKRVRRRRRARRSPPRAAAAATATAKPVSPVGSAVAHALRAFAIASPATKRRVSGSKRWAMPPSAPRSWRLLPAAGVPVRVPGPVPQLSIDLRE